MNLTMFPDEALRKRSGDVESGDQEAVETLRAMHEFMLSEGGIGLAAPQVGIRKRMFVADLRDGTGPTFFMNPVVRPLGSAVASGVEGCLSVPGAWGEVERPCCIVVRGYDIRWRPVEALYEGLMARVVQHETDHLDGVLHLDRMVAHVRRMALDSVWNTVYAKGR